MVVVVVIVVIIAIVFIEGLVLVEDAALFGALLLHKLIVHRSLLPGNLLLLPIQPQNQRFRLRRRRCVGILKGDRGRHARAGRRWCSAAAAHACSIARNCFSNLQGFLFHLPVSESRPFFGFGLLDFWCCA